MVPGRWRGAGGGGGGRSGWLERLCSGDILFQNYFLVLVNRESFPPFIRFPETQFAFATNASCVRNRGNIVKSTRKIKHHNNFCFKNKRSAMGANEQLVRDYKSLVRVLWHVINSKVL